MKARLLAFASLFLVLSMPAHAVTPDGSIVTAVEAAVMAAGKSLILPQALAWLGSFMAIQFVLTNIGLLKSGADIEAVFGKFIGSLIWFGFCIYVLTNGPSFIDKVGTEMLQKFMPAWISPGYILTAIGGIAAALLATVGLTGVMAFGTGSPMLALVAIVVLFVVIGVGLGLSIKIFMLKLELGLIVLLAPLSFSLLGINALKDQGIAPFKSLISLVYRIILLGVICAAFKEVSTTTDAALKAIDWGINPLIWVDKSLIMISSIFAYPMLGYLAYKSDSIAANLAGGTTSMGTGDVAAAAALGAAAGAAVAAGGASIGATKPVQSMASFMKDLAANSKAPSVSNAGSGSGGSGGRIQSPTSLNSMPSHGGGKASTPPVDEKMGTAGATGYRANQGLLERPEHQGMGSETAGVVTPANGSNAGSGSGGAGGGGAQDSASGGGIAGGAPSRLEDTLGALNKQFEKMNEPKAAPRPGFADQLGKLNHLVSHEHAATSVSINTHSD